jgi:hypothetical protein
MHDADLLPGWIFCAHVAGVAEAGFFDDGEGVEVGADEKARAGAVFKDGYDSVGLAAIGIFADVFGDGVAGFAGSSSKAFSIGWARG